MTLGQREAVLAYLAEAATLTESAAMAGASSRDFESDFLQGKRDAELGVESELGSWYRELAATRARVRATLRAEAREERGSRAATDALQLLAVLEAEREPTALADSDNVRASSSILSLVDKIESESDPVERQRLRGVQENAELALHELFSEMVKS